MNLDRFISILIGSGFLLGLFGIPVAYGIDLIAYGQFSGVTRWVMTTAGIFMIGGIILHVGHSLSKT